MIKPVPPSRHCLFNQTSYGYCTQNESGGSGKDHVKKQEIRMSKKKNKNPLQESSPTKGFPVIHTSNLSGLSDTMILLSSCIPKSVAAALADA